MRLLAALPALLMLPACQSTTAEGPATPGQSAGKCSPDGLDAFVGRKVSSELGAELLAKSGARSLRWGPPGAAMTMDFREDRLNLDIDEHGKITRAHCG